MKSDFMLAINQLCTERKLSREVVLEAVEAALISAYKRNFGSSTNIEARIEPSTGEAHVYAIKDVVETVQDPKMQITLEDARRVDPETALEQTVMIESTPRDFGRIAAQTAKQVILQRIREAERDALYSTFVDKAGEIALGTVQSVEYHSGDVIVNVDGAEALLPSREQVPGERHRRGARLRAYVVDVRRGNRGPQITLSRRSPALLSRLLELEVPEIFNGSVEVKAIAREAGSRSKVAVHATQDGVDPVGSCVGVRGGRIQSVVNELGGEKIDVVQWNPEMASFIGNALSPARVMNVLLDETPDGGKTATVIVPDRQLSLAIGKEGQNARLAAKLTGWRIDIKSATETAEETLGRLEEMPIPREEMDLLMLAESILRGSEQVEAGAAEGVAVEAEVGEPAEVVAEAGAEEGMAPEMAELATQEGPASDVAEEALASEPASSLADPEGAGLIEEALVEAGVDDEAEAIPSFEGEPVEDSLGWVSTEPAEEYQYEWEEASWEEPEETWKPSWEEEIAEKRSESPKPQTKKRKKKSRRFGNASDGGAHDPNKWRR